jgi:hypothetical protein
LEDELPFGSTEKGGYGKLARGNSHFLQITPPSRRAIDRNQGG